MPLLDAVMKEPRPLVILSEKVDGAALGMLVHNAAHGTLEAIAVRAPGFGHRRIAHLKDLAAFTGGEVITDDAGLTLSNVKREYLGSRAPRDRRPSTAARSSRARARAESIETRMSQIRNEAERAPHENDREIARERLAKLSSKLAVIHVGAATQTSCSTRSATAPRARCRRPAPRCRRGSCPEGGPRCCAPSARSTTWSSRATTRSAPTWCARCSPSRCTGSPPTRATTAPRRSTRCGRCRRARGLNALTGEFGDLISGGVIDPVRVTRLTIENAASVAALLLTTEAVVAEELIAQPGAIIAPGFGDLAEGLARPSSPV